MNSASSRERVAGKPCAWASRSSDSIAATPGRPRRRSMIGHSLFPSNSSSCSDRSTARRNCAGRTTAARSTSVRATLVTGIPRCAVRSTSGRSRVRIRCSPGKSRRPAALATTSVVSPRSSRSSCHSAAPLKAPSIDPGPRASVAACHRTMSPDWRWPSAYTPRRTAMSRPARTQREIRPGVSPAVSNCLRDTSPCCASASSTSAGSMSLFGRTRTRTRHREAPVGHRGRIATGAPPFRYERCDFESYPE